MPSLKNELICQVGLRYSRLWFVRIRMSEISERGREREGRERESKLLGPHEAGRSVQKKKKKRRVAAEEEDITSDEEGGPTGGKDRRTTKQQQRQTMRHETAEGAARARRGGVAESRHVF